MDKDGLKIYLIENKEILEDLLERINLVHIRNVRNEYLTCGFSESRRKDSINVWLNEGLSVKAWSVNEEINDIYGLIQYQEQCSFFEAVQFAFDVCGIKIGRGRGKCVERFMKRKKTKKEYERPVNKGLGYSTGDMFVAGIADIFLKDGIEEDTQELFDVGVDVLNNRIVFPIRDYEGNVLTFKGRTLNNDYLTTGEPKYLYYQPFNGRYYLFGYYENYNYIMDSEYIIIGESEKFVMQLHSMGHRNAVATAKKKVSKEQAIEINKLNKKVILAYDNDVDVLEIFGECAKFSGEVYYIKDEGGLLGTKDSPSDKGKEVFETLLENKIKYER